MRRLLFVLVSILIVMDTFSQGRSTSDRQPVAAGRFYSANKETLTKDLQQLFESCVKVKGLNVRAIISPHAGYIFSGKIAAAAFSAIDRNTPVKNIFIIGSSHIMAFDGASIYNSGDFITPLGRMKVNQELATKLKNENRVFNNPVSAHFQEHSIEVQVPFIQYYFKSDPMIVPIIIGTNNTNTIKKIADALKPYFTKENLFVISSDFCHYPDYDDAKEVDNITANSIVSGDPQVFLTTQRKTASRNIPGLSTSMCGWTSGLVLMYLAEGNPNLEYKRIDYCNSGDSPYGNKEEVVGYHAIALIEKGNLNSGEKSLTDEISFTPEEKKVLFDLARNTIYSALYYNKKYTPDKETIPKKFNVPYGAFVTLKIKGVLRGCIGRFISQDPLYKAVIESAYSSAFEDPRFTPLTKEEFKRVEIEITVLGPLRKINNINEIVLGKHGIYIKKDFRSGTMLPQVAIEQGWTVEEFLGYTSRDKAGIGWDGWKNAEIFVYEGIVLEENEK